VKTELSVVSNQPPSSDFGAPRWSVASSVAGARCQGWNRRSIWRVAEWNSAIFTTFYVARIGNLRYGRDCHPLEQIFRNKYI
jgi:hypothetical protein